MNILEDKHTCLNCGKEVLPWAKVCSLQCTGALGGKKKVPKGFAISGKASEAGRKGGSISRRTKRVTA